MSRKNRHYTSLQRKASFHAAQIQRGVRNVERHWWNLAPHFAAMRDERLYAELDFATFSAWCESTNISPAHGYFLAQWHNLPTAIKNPLQRIGIGRAKLLIHHVEESLAQGIAETKIVEFIEDQAELTWHDLRQELHGDFEPRFVPAMCPHCNGRIMLSRAALVRLPNEDERQ